MPGFQEFGFVALDDFLDRKELIWSEPAAAVEHDRIDPEFGRVLVSLNVDMWRFLTVVCVEEKPVGADSQGSWHDKTLLGSGQKAMQLLGCARGKIRRPVIAATPQRLFLFVRRSMLCVRCSMFAERSPRTQKRGGTLRARLFGVV
jgi:hypothetical protein